MYILIRKTVVIINKDKNIPPFRTLIGSTKITVPIIVLHDANLVYDDVVCF